jgi:hypothetical protein
MHGTAIFSHGKTAFIYIFNYLFIQELISTLLLKKGSLFSELQVDAVVRLTCKTQNEVYKASSETPEHSL